MGKRGGVAILLSKALFLAAQAEDSKGMGNVAFRHRAQNRHLSLYTISALVLIFKNLKKIY